VDFFVDTV